MKMNARFNVSLLTLLLFGTAVISNTAVHASEHGGNGTVSVEGNESSKPVDPENPGVEVDPGEGPSTKGDLRIDFVSSLNFGSAEITAADRKIDSLAQLFHSDTTARGYYIQVSDYRSEASGWTLTLSQDAQFSSSIIQDLENQSLEGAVLSFGNGWANSDGNSGTPTVSRDTLGINEMGTAYTVATAGDQQGKGIWTIAFGASGENSSNQENTLSALTDSNGNEVTDATFNKPAYNNGAVFLTIPDAVKIYPVQYTTALTWTLEAGPTE